MEVKNISDREQYELILKDQGYDNQSIVDMIREAVTDMDEYPGISCAVEEGALTSKELDYHINQFINSSVVEFVLSDECDTDEYDVQDYIYDYVRNYENMDYFRDIDSSYYSSYERQMKQWNDEQDELWNDYYRSAM